MTNKSIGNFGSEIDPSDVQTKIKYRALLMVYHYKNLKALGGVVV